MNTKKALLWLFVLILFGCNQPYNSGAQTPTPEALPVSYAMPVTETGTGGDQMYPDQPIHVKICQEARVYKETKERDSNYLYTIPSGTEFGVNAIAKEWVTIIPESKPGARYQWTPEYIKTDTLC